MGSKITKQELIEIVRNSELDQTIKDIFVRDIESEGANEFYIDQVMAYCDQAMGILKEKLTDEQKQQI